MPLEKKSVVGVLSLWSFQFYENTCVCVFLLSGNVNAAWYRDNVSRQVVMPFMPRHLLWGGGRGGGQWRVFQHDSAPAHTALLTENVLHTNDIYVME